MTCCGIFLFDYCSRQLRREQHAAQGSYQFGLSFAGAVEKSSCCGGWDQRGHHRHLVYDKLYRRGSWMCIGAELEQATDKNFPASRSQP